MAKDIKEILSEIGGEASMAAGLIKRALAGDAQAKVILGDAVARCGRIHSEAVWALAEMEKPGSDGLSGSAEPEGETDPNKAEKSE
jgi:hypothetical protein